MATKITSQEDNTADDGEGITTMDTGKEEQHEVSDPTFSIATDFVATSADAHPDDTTEGSNETNANGIIFTPGIYLEVFNILPIKIHR